MGNFSRLSQGILAVLILVTSVTLTGCPGSTTSTTTNTGPERERRRETTTTELAITTTSTEEAATTTTEEQATTTTTQVSREQQNAYLDFEIKFFETGEPGFEAFNRLADVISRYNNGEATPEEVIRVAQRTQSECGSVAERYSELRDAVPASLPDDVKSELKSATDDASDSFLRRSLAADLTIAFFKAAPGSPERDFAEQKYIEDVRNAELFYRSAIDALNRARQKLGLPPSLTSKRNMGLQELSDKNPPFNVLEALKRLLEN